VIYLVSNLSEVKLLTYSDVSDYVDSYKVNRFYVRFEVIHGDDYEECRLLEYKIPVRISQETHTLRSRYRTQPVNAMSDLRLSQWC
jgi:hypothetical protein